jgi:excinuclease UvrABC nuclease subunit
MMQTPITSIQSLPKVSGIYKVIDANKQVIYIGQAKNIYLRWNQGHHKMSEILSRCGINAYIECVEVPEWLLNRAENAAISFYNPPLNRKKTPVV